MSYLMLRLGGVFFSSALPTSCWHGAGMLLQREPLRLSLASFSVPWVLGAAAVYSVSYQQLQAPSDSIWGTSLPMLESFTCIVGWDTRAVADDDA